METQQENITELHGSKGFSPHVLGDPYSQKELRYMWWLGAVDRGSTMASSIQTFPRPIRRVCGSVWFLTETMYQGKWNWPVVTYCRCVESCQATPGFSPHSWQGTGIAGDVDKVLWLAGTSTMAVRGN